MTLRTSHTHLRYLLTMALLLSFAANALAADASPLGSGGFVVSQQADGSWMGGAPPAFGPEFESAITGANAGAQDPDEVEIQLSSLSLPWQIAGESTTIRLLPQVAGGDLRLTVRGWGTLAPTPNLELLKQQTTVDDTPVSFLSGSAMKSLPTTDAARIIGLSLAQAKVAVPANEAEHPLEGAQQVNVLYAAIEYIAAADASSTITTVEALRQKTVHSVVVMGLQGRSTQNRNQVLECRWIDDGPGACSEAKTAPLDALGVEVGLDANLTTRSLNTPQGGALQTVNLPASTINRIINIGVTQDLEAVRVGAPGGSMLLVDLPDFAVPVPGIQGGLKFSRSRASLTLGSSHTGTALGFSIDAGLENPGALLGPLGQGISGPKRVTLTVEDKTLIVNFRNSLQDLKPLGLQLSEPTVAVDLSRKSALLSGSVVLPDHLPEPLRGQVDVTCELSKSNPQFTLMSSVEMPIFEDRIRLSLNTIVLGKSGGNFYFMSMGKARFVKDVSMLQGVDAFKDLGLDLSIGAEVTASIFMQSDGAMHVELLTEDLIALQMGPVDTNLDEVKFVLEHTPGSPWVASLAGQTSLDINKGIFTLHATTRAEISSTGTLKIQVPDDPENPTRIEVGELELILQSGEFLVGKNAAGQFEMSVDATAKTQFPAEIPLIGGQDLVGHMAMKSDGSFVFEITEIPQLEFENMRVGLTGLKIENKKENNTFLLTFEAGAGVEFMSDFALEPLRNEKLTGTVSLSSDLTVKFALTGMNMTIGDFRFGLDELSIALVKGRDIAVSGTGLLQVAYPSSKYFGIGLPAALAGLSDGPSFDLRGTLSISTTNVYFQAQSDSSEIPIDIPEVVEGITLRLESVGIGITYAGIPLFDIKGAVYLPDLAGNGETGKTPTLERPYDSRLGLTLAGNIQEGLVVALDVEGEPELAIQPVLEVSLKEAGLSTWLYGYTWGYDLSARLKVGQPGKGFGTLFDLEGGHLTYVPLFPTPIVIPIPFHDKCRAEADVGGFGFMLETEFPRPELLDIGVALEAIQYIQSGEAEEIFKQCGTGGKFNAMFPRFAVNEAGLMMPEKVAELLDTPDSLNLLEGAGGRIDLNAGDIVPHLSGVVKAVSNPQDTMANLVAAIPPDKREGEWDARIGIGNFDLLSGRMHYRLQAREAVTHVRTVPGLSNILRTVNYLNAAESRPGAFTHQHWKMTETPAGYMLLRNRQSGKFLTADRMHANASNAAVKQFAYPRPIPLMQWTLDDAPHGRRRLFNRKTDKLLSLDGTEVVVSDEESRRMNQWRIRPVFGTRYVRLVRAGRPQVIAIPSGNTENHTPVQLESLPVQETVTAKGTNFVIRNSAINVATAWQQVDTFLQGVDVGPGTTPQQFMQTVRQRAGGRPVHGSDTTGLTVRLTPHIKVMVSPYGRVVADIGGGALQLRTMVANPPRPGLVGTLRQLRLASVASMGQYPYSGITTPRDMTMGNPDCYAARTWKRLWSMRDTTRPIRGLGSTITMHLNNGVTASMAVKAQFRRDRMVRTWSGGGWHWVRISDFRPVSSLVVRATDGALEALCAGSGFVGQADLFLPASTNRAGGAPGISGATTSLTQEGVVPTGGFEEKLYDPEFTFRFSDTLGWEARLKGTESLTLVSPEGARRSIPLGSGLRAALNEALTGKTDGRSYDSAGSCAFYLAQSDGTSRSGSVTTGAELVSEVGPVIEKRTVQWTQNGDNLSATISAQGALSGVYGLTPTTGNQSARTIRTGQIEHEVVVSRLPIRDELTEETLATSAGGPVRYPYGKYKAQVFLNKGGQQYRVPVVSALHSRVRDPGFRELPLALDLDGDMSIGDKTLIQTALGFAGHVDEAGGVALAANGNITVHGFELASSSFEFQHYPDGSDNGLTFEGDLNAPFQGHLEGEIHENGNFHVAGDLSLLIPNVAKTGFEGRVVMDPGETWIHGAIYAGGQQLMYTHTRITSNGNKVTASNENGFNVGVGGYYKYIWPLGNVWVAYSGVRGGLNTDIVFKYKKPQSITASVEAYLGATVLDASLGDWSHTWEIPNLRKVRTRTVLGRELQYRPIPIFIKWDAPWPISDPQIGSR